MDITKTLESCIITLGAMRPRVDQPEISDAARAVIRALDGCRTEALRMQKEIEALSAAPAEETSGGCEESATSAPEEG